MLVKEHATTVEIKSFQTKMTMVTMASNFIAYFNYHKDEILDKMSEFEERDSGWTLTRIIRVELNMYKCDALKGSNHFELPEKLKHKKAVINVENDDVYCFKWAILSRFHTSAKPQRCSSYGVDISSDTFYVGGGIIKLDFSGLNFPMKIEDIKKFTALNHHISLNVFGYDAKDNKVFGPLFSEGEEKEIHINLLYVDGPTAYVPGHFVWIRNMSR